jgi:hypothetical protein
MTGMTNCCLLKSMPQKKPGDKNENIPSHQSQTPLARLHKTTSTSTSLPQNSLVIFT